MHPQVSVVMSVYNGEEYLEEAIKSILAQTFHDFEFIIMDDGSTDATIDILHKYETIDDRIRVYHQANSGLTASLNNGCQIAQGKYIARLDHDDVSVSARLERQVEFLERNPSVALVGTAFVLTGPTGLPVRTVHFPSEDHQIKELLLSYNCICHSTVMMRKDALQSLGGYRTAALYAEDYDLWIRMTERYALANLLEMMVYRRVHPTQVSLTNIEQQVISVVGVQAAARERRETGCDPIDHIHRITPGVLKKLGVGSEAIQRARAATYLWWAELLLEMGDEEAALGLLTKASSSGQLRFFKPSLVARVYWSAAKKCRQTGKISRRVLLFLQAALIIFAWLTSLHVPRKDFVASSLGRLTARARTSLH